jgi:hypothetical protein
MRRMSLNGLIKNKLNNGGIKLFVYEVKKDTPKYEIIDGIFNWSKPITEHKDELNELLGIDINKNLAECTYCLLLSEIPEGARDQFKKEKTEGGFMKQRRIHRLIKNIKNSVKNTILRKEILLNLVLNILQVL